MTKQVEASGLEAIKGVVHAAMQDDGAPAQADDQPAKEARPDAESKTQSVSDRRQIAAIWRKQGEHVAWVFARTIGFDQDQFARVIQREKTKLEKQAREAQARLNKDAAGKSEGEDAAEGSADGAAGDAESAASSGSGGGWTKVKDPIKPLPDNSPVRPVGTANGTYFYLDPNNQLRDLKASDHTANGLRDLFSPRVDFLWGTWPKYSAATGNQTGWQADKAADSLITACGERGVVNAYERVRGLGAWTAADGSLVLHCGDAIWHSGAWQTPGEYDAYIYTAQARAPRPADPAADAQQEKDFDGLLEDLLKLFDTWNWREDIGQEAGSNKVMGHALSSILFFGGLAAGMGGGALKWRPHLWVTGDANCGKSSLLMLAEQLIGDMVKAGDATQAGVWSQLGPSTRTVLLDEMENEPGSRKVDQLVRLARKSASGDMILRGSSDHKGVSFQARSLFIFSSIIIPPMLGQDVSRFAVLNLEPQTGEKTLKLDPVRNAALGRIIRRRLLDGWSIWPEVFERWRTDLVQVGHSARGADQFGTLLAMYDLIRWRGELGFSERTIVCAPLSRAALDAENYAPSNAEAMLNHLLSVPLDVFRGGTRMSIGELVEIACVMNSNTGEGVATPESCKNALRAHGVFVEGVNMHARVTLPNQNEGLRRLFENTQWRGDPGASGGWVQGVRRLEGVQAVNSRKCGGRGWSVPAKVFLQFDGSDDGKQA